MAMGVVSDDDFEAAAQQSNKRKSEPEPSVPEKTVPSAASQPLIQSNPDNVIRRPFHGRNPNDNNVPSIVREIIADDTQKTGAQLAQTFGVSESSVSAYQHGNTSTASYDKPDDKLKQVVTQRRERINRKSNRALIRVLNKLDSDEFEAKLDECKPTELSTVAVNISRVVQSSDAASDVSVKQQNIIFYAPTPVKTDSFEVIDLGRKIIDAPASRG